MLFHAIWNSFQFKEYYNRIMHDLSPLQLEKTVKLQFGKKCGHFEYILSHIADDFIARYSTKQQVHPDFFKEDALLVFKRFTLYSDQCIQAMKKFAFMDIPAEIWSTLTTSMLKVNDYLAKQVYQHIKMEQQQHRTHIAETLCSSCSKLRQNEKLRGLRQELNLTKIDLNCPKVIRQVMTRKGQKYSFEQLLQQELQTLESLNENQVRKRLGKLQIDHDRCRQEIIVCLQELARANQRITGYSKAIEKKDCEECQFDIKQYIFQISMHFYQNISSLDHKIKQLKQALNPMVNFQTQTETQIVIKFLHEEVVNRYISDIQKLKLNIQDTQSKIIIEQTKYKQQTVTCQMLQKKLREAEVQREQQKINQKIAQTQMKGALQKYQRKSQDLQKIVEKLKSTTVDAGKLLSNKLQNKCEINNLSSLNELLGPAVQKQSKKILKSCLSLKKTQFKQNLLNVRLQQKINLLKDSTRANPGYINDLTQSIEKIYTEIYQQNRHRLRIKHVFDECLCLHLTKKEAMNLNQNRQRMSLYSIQPQNIPESCDQKAAPHNKFESIRYSQSENSSKIYKKGVVKLQDKKTKFQKLSSLKLKQNLTFLQNQNKGCIKIDEAKRNQFSAFDPKALKPRNLSQQSSFDQKDQIENFRRIIDKLVTKDLNLFSQEDNKILFSLKNSQQGQKFNKKNTVFRQASLKTVLSLQQINYSTYFYSLIARLHVKNPLAYANLKKMLSIIHGQGNEQDGVKNFLNALISNHRKCKRDGSMCSHLQIFLQKVKNL